jgi:hypothetical protein
MTKWRWFVLAMIHLRCADAAEQLEETLDTPDDNNQKPIMIMRRRRASLFGAVMGIYQDHTQDRVTTVTRCIGDPVMNYVSVGQALRIRKSNAAHRIACIPKLYFDDVRPGEPRRLPSTGKEVELPGLLAALKAAKKNNSTQRVAAATQHQPDNRSTRNRVYDSVEYHLPRHGHIFDILRKIYDPEDHAHVTNQYYAPALLLQRESLRFDPQIQQLLRMIWNAADMDDSGAIDRLEYMELHNCINCALIGRAAGDSMMRIFLCQDDWNAGLSSGVGR